MVKITINLTRKELEHIRECSSAERDACSEVNNIIKKVKKQLKINRVRNK